MFGADRPDVRVLGQPVHANVCLPEAHVDGQIVHPQRLLGGFLELVGMADVIVGQVRIHLVEIPPVQLEGLRFAGILACEVPDLVAVVSPVELLELVNELLVGGLGHSVLPEYCSLA